MSSDQPMLDVGSDTFTQDFLSSLLQENTSPELDAAIQKPLPESPSQSTGMVPKADAQDVSSETLQQPIAQPCSMQQNDETSVTSQESPATGSPEVQRSGTPSSLDEGLKNSEKTEEKAEEKAEDLIEGFSSLWTEKEEHIITKPFDYIKAFPSKNFRGQILSALNIWLQVDSHSLSIIDRVVDLLHNASLLIDDIQDGSDLRRGSPTAHRVFGTAQSINAANYAYVLAQQEVLRLKNPLAMQIFVEELLNLHRGQGIELFWRDTFTVPSEEEYLLMVSNKTGGLFRLATGLMQAVSSTTYDVLPLVEMIGLIFQVRDDHENLNSEQMTLAKGYCEDLTEGKFSMPVIHSIHNSPTSNNEILNILKLRTTNVELKTHALRYMQAQTNSLAYTRTRLSAFHRIAQALLARIEPRNQLLEILLRKLSLE